MRSAALVLCLLGWASVASGQVGVPTGPGTFPNDRPRIFVGPSYRNPGSTFNYSVPPNAAATARIPQIGAAPGIIAPPPPIAARAAPRPPATFFYNPHYPSLNFTPQVDIRPQEYVLPPLTWTPLHDPYFEERVFLDFEDEYEFWGW